MCCPKIVYCVHINLGDESTMAAARVNIICKNFVCFRNRGWGPGKGWGTTRLRYVTERETAGLQTALKAVFKKRPKSVIEHGNVFIKFIISKFSRISWHSNSPKVTSIVDENKIEGTRILRLAMVKRFFVFLWLSVCVLTILYFGPFGNACLQSPRDLTTQ